MGTHRKEIRKVKCSNRNKKHKYSTMKHGERLFKRINKVGKQHPKQKKKKEICTRLLKSLLESNDLYDRLFSINNKYPSPKISAWLNSAFAVPNDATLTMNHVRQLFIYRHNLHSLNILDNPSNNIDQKQHIKIPTVNVVEPQSYDTITLLKPSHYMFDENIDVHTKDAQEVGYFHSGKSGLAHSGDGGDFGDPWWLANHVLANLIDKKLRTGKKLLDTFCSTHRTLCKQIEYVS